MTFVQGDLERILNFDQITKVIKLKRHRYFVETSTVSAQIDIKDK